MKIGIFGGTFNPIHFAHLRIVEEIRETFALSKVIFVPAATPPHKPLADDLSFAERLKMVTLAVEDNPFFSVSDVEGQREGKSYSIDTLRIFREKFPGDELFLIMGSDSFADFRSWKNYAAIFSCCNIVAITRPGTSISLLEALPVDIAHEFCYHESQNRISHRSGYSVYRIEGTQLDISSTAIRSLIRQGKSIKYLLPATVEHYIKQQRFYE
ncbi:MAG: nicotinate-nucleotide adenylyltransferase [Deltaproteobacteria bacterium]|nr:nicotinate-nucleotide adenylyltransferase [Deltaproteobacteria bacterium]